MRCWSSFVFGAQARLRSAFSRHGSLVARRPGMVIAVATIFFIVATAGLARLESEDDGEILFSPSTSRAWDARQSHTDAFGALTADLIDVHLALVGGDSDDTAGSNLLMAGPVWNALFDIHDMMWSFLSTRNETLQDICLPIAGECRPLGALEFTGLDRSAVQADMAPVVLDVVSRNSTGATGGLLSISPPYFGGVVDSDSLELVSSLRYQVVVEISKTPGPFFTWLRAFEDHMIATVVPEMAIRGYDVSFLTPLSINDELERSSTNDIPLFAIAIGVMVVFACFAFSSLDCVDSSVSVGFAAVLSVLMGVSSAFGVASFFGVKFATITAVMPFLIVGIGLDDAFIIRDAVFAVQSAANPEERFALALASVGPSIFMTSLTDGLAFAVGTSSAFPAVRWFCLNAMLAVAFDFFFQITVFVAAMVFDDRRQKSGRCSVVCCLRAPTSCRRNRPHGLARRSSYLSRFMRGYYNPLIMKTPVRIAVVVAFAILLGVSLFGATQLKEGLEFRDLVPDDSYVRPFLDSLEDNYNVGVTVTVFFTDAGVDVTAPAGQDEVIQLFQDLQSTPVVRTGSAVCWLPLFLGWADRVHGDELDSNGRVPTDLFVPWLAEWLFLEPVFADAVVIENLQHDVDVGALGRAIANGSDLCLSDFLAWAAVTHADELGLSSVPQSALISWLASEWLPADSTFASAVSVTGGPVSAFSCTVDLVTEDNGSREQGLQMVALRDVLDASSTGAEATNQQFVFYEQFLVIRRETALNLVLALAVVGVVTLVLLVHPGLAALVCLMVVMIDVCTVGFMHFWGVTLDSISSIVLVLAIGFSVDFCAHVAHAFAHHTGTRKDRACAAMCEVGASVSLGGFSTFLGVVALAFASSQIFVVFFKVLFLVIVFSLLHGLLLLPVLLSLIGPSWTVETGTATTLSSRDDSDSTPTSVTSSSTTTPADS